MPTYTCDKCGHESKFDGRKAKTPVVLTNCNWGECQRDWYVDSKTGEIIKVQLADSVFVK